MLSYSKRRQTKSVMCHRDIMLWLLIRLTFVDNGISCDSCVQLLFDCVVILFSLLLLLLFRSHLVTVMVTVTLVSFHFSFTVNSHSFIREWMAPNRAICIFTNRIAISNINWNKPIQICFKTNGYGKNLSINLKPKIAWNGERWEKEFLRNFIQPKITRVKVLNLRLKMLQLFTHSIHNVI